MKKEKLHHNFSNLFEVRNGKVSFTKVKMMYFLKGLFVGLYHYSQRIIDGFTNNIYDYIVNPIEEVVNERCMACG